MKVIREELENHCKDWTYDEKELMKEFYPYCDNEFMVQIIKRTKIAIEAQASIMNLKKVSKSQGGHISLIYKGEEVGRAALDHQNHLKKALTAWYYNIVPALKRGESVSIELQFGMD